VTANEPPFDSRPALTDYDQGVADTLRVVAMQVDLHPDWDRARIARFLVEFARGRDPGRATTPPTTRAEGANSVAT
jgi:hypothetical protein